MSCKNITDLSVFELYHLFGSRGQILTWEQKNALILHSVKQEKISHLSVMFDHQFSQRFNWNLISDGFTLLGLAIDLNLIRSVRFLLYVPMVDKHTYGEHEYGPTRMTGILICLHMAEECPNSPMINYLIENNEIDVNQEVEGGTTALHHAVMMSDSRYLRKILTRCDLDINPYYTTHHILATASYYNQHENARILLADSRTHINPYDFGYKPLLEAIMQCRVEMVKLFLQSGADPNATIKTIQDNDMAMYHVNTNRCMGERNNNKLFKRIEIGKLLLNMGASPPIDDHSTARILQDQDQYEHHENAENQKQTVRTLTNLSKTEPLSLALIARNAVYAQLRRVCGQHNTNEKRRQLIQTMELPVTLKKIIANE